MDIYDPTVEMQEEIMNQTKPFTISKWDVVQAYRSVKANHGAAGVDHQSIVNFGH